jgi:hypothetical protein
MTPTLRVLRFPRRDRPTVSPTLRAITFRLAMLSAYAPEYVEALNLMLGELCAERGIPSQQPAGGGQ